MALRLCVCSGGSLVNAEIVLTEVGGTVGDIEGLPFLEAIRQMRVEEGYENTLYVHVALVPVLDVTGEMKTKPLQHSVNELRLDSHAAAREVGEDSPARSAARAAGQAVATAHVPRHAYGSAMYAQQAIYRSTNPSDADAAVAKERDWQYQHLLH